MHGSGPELSSGEILVPNTPSGLGWVHEIKYDGYRIQLYRRDGSTRALMRNGHDWTERFSALS